MAPTLVLLDDREQQIIQLLRDALERPNNYAVRTQVFGTKKLMIRIGQPRHALAPEPSVWELVIRHKP